MFFKYLPKYCTIILIFLAHLSFAQEFGGNPPSMKWRQIDTDTVRVIFPENLDNQAQRVANTLHYLNRNTRQSIGENQKKLNVVLQNQTVLSNGYVGLAPFRSEFYLNAPQSSFDLGTNWLDMLSIHEYRHALQFMNTRQGLTKLAYYLSGEFGWSYFSSLSVPNWFWEGDAVVSETALTAQGRGRIPAFYNGYKSLVFGQKTYDYQKARNGSIKDFVPNHYELGFLLCTYGRQQFENDAWREVIRDAARYRGLFYPFSKATKRHFGYGTKSLYERSMDYYGKQWADQAEQTDGSEAINTKGKRTFTNYQFPYQLENGDILVYKASFDQIGGFYVFGEDRKERLIRRQGRVIDNYFSYNNNLIAWAESGQDERWSWQTMSNIVVYDMQSKERRRITRSSRYFSPDISNDGKKIVVVSFSPEMEYRLHVISSEDGKLMNEIRNKESYFYSYPKWSIDGRHFIALARDKQGKNGMVSIEISSGQHEILVPFTSHQLGIPHETDQYIFFPASFSGIDNIFALNKQSGDIHQVTNGNLGSYQPFLNTNNHLYFSRFSSNGAEIRTLNLEENKWIKIQVMEPVDMPEYDFVANEAEGGDITQEIPKESFETRKYSKSSGLINLHSWSLFFADPNYEWALMSNNILNTLNMDLGVRYNRNDEAFTYFFNANYAQYYPVLSISATTGKRSALTLVRDQNDVVVDTARVSWWESIVRPGVTLPFNLSSGQYTRQLNVSGNYSFTGINFTKSVKEAFENADDFSYDSYSTGISFLNRRKKARKNIYSKNSQYFNVNYSKALGSEVSEQFFVDSEWTFPGLLVNHNLVFQASFQNEAVNSFPRFSDNFFYSRGYERPLYDMIYKVGTNYHFPIVYPDWGLWGIFYLYRLRGNAFFDYSRAHIFASETTAESIQLYNSTGLELILDTRILNLYDFTFGFRYSYLLNDDPMQLNTQQQVEFFIPVMRF